MKANFTKNMIQGTLAVIMAMSCLSLEGQWRETEKVVASDREADDRFGESVAVSGDYAIVGAPQEDHNAAGGSLKFGSGSVYIFKRDEAGNWIQVQKIVASDRAANDNFGSSVAIYGDYVIVGATGDDSFRGSAYIFKKDNEDNWIEIQKILANDNETFDFFGNSVALSEDYAIVGAHQEEEDAEGNNELSNSGSAYIFKRDEAGNWSQVQKIVANDRAAEDGFSSSVAISGDYIVVGAESEDEDEDANNTSAQSGSAYIFKRDEAGNWTQVQKIVADDRASVSFFGGSVSISDNYAIVGAAREDRDAEGNNSLTDSGSAYIFKRNETDNWTQIQKIVADDRGEDDRFGKSVSILGDQAIVGARFEGEDADGNNNLDSSGSAYIFKKDDNDNWVQIRKIAATDRGAQDQFGVSVSISANSAIVGAHFEDEDKDGNNPLGASGSAYVFQYKDTQSITLQSMEGEHGDTFTLSETTDAGLVIEYSIADNNIATVNGNSVTAVGSGTTTITANQSGNNDFWEAQEVIKDLTIDKATLTVTADDKSKTYGDANPELSYSYSGFVLNEDEGELATEPSIAVDADENSQVGMYVIQTSGGTSDNYEFNHISGTLTVDKATLTATPADISLNEGESFPSSFSVDYSGFVLNEDDSVIDTPPTATPDVNDTSVPGTYTIMVDGGQDNNYDFVYEQGTLTVNEVLGLLKENAISVYPNPTTEFIHIGDSQVDVVEIYNMKGIRVLTSSQQKLNLSNLESGTYLIKLIGAKGKILSSNKVVKQ